MRKIDISRPVPASTCNNLRENNKKKEIEMYVAIFQQTTEIKDENSRFCKFIFIDM